MISLEKMIVPTRSVPPSFYVGSVQQFQLTPVTTPRRADVTDPVSPVFGSATDWLCFCEPLADSDADNDSE